jgi:hypothetical protein
MEVLFRKIADIFFHTYVPFYCLCAIGLWALLWWSYENLKSPVQVIKGVLSPYFQPNENKSLVERYGKWAG